MNEAPLLEGVSSGGWRDFYLQTRQTWPLAWFSSENSAMGLQWDATLCSVDHFLTFSRTVKMAMVSEFLGQLSLNIGVMSYLFYFIHYVQKIHSILFIFFFFPSHSDSSFDSSELWAQIPDCGSCFGLWPRQRCSQNRDCYQNQRQDTVLNMFAPKKEKKISAWNWNSPLQMSSWYLWVSVLA